MDSWLGLSILVPTPVPSQAPHVAASDKRMGSLHQRPPRAPGRRAGRGCLSAKTPRSLLHATSLSRAFKNYSYRGSPPPCLSLPGGKSRSVEFVPEATKKRLIAFRESCHLCLVSSLPPISLGRLCSQRWQLRLRELSLKTCVPGCVPGHQRPGCSLLQIYCCTTFAEKKEPYVLEE